MSNIPNEVILPVHINQQQSPRIPPPTADSDTMERLVQALFYRIAVLYARTIRKHIRRLGETAIRVMAIICMILLIYLHVVFNQKRVTCLSHLHDHWPRQGVLRVELFFESPPEGYNLQQSYAKEFQYSHFYNYDENQLNQSISKQNEGILPVIEIPIEPLESDLLKESYPNMSINSSLLTSIDYSSKSIMKNEAIETAQIIDDNYLSESQDNHDNESLFDYLFNFDWIKQLLIEEHYILEYSIEYGFLRLSPETRQRLNIEVLLVTLDVTNNTGFGNGLSRFMLDQFLGYQEIFMSSIKQLAEKETHKGYVRNVMTNDHFRFVSIWQNRRLWTYLVALCIMIVFTVSISMLLRYSHFQIFLFITAPLLTVILALIGMEAIMWEFSSDASTGNEFLINIIIVIFFSLAFYIILI
ncbi:unnamed protein product, partial [Rotaria sp. Silwood2]